MLGKSSQIWPRKIRMSCLSQKKWDLILRLIFVFDIRSMCNLHAIILEMITLTAQTATFVSQTFYQFQKDKSEKVSPFNLVRSPGLRTLTLISWCSWLVWVDTYLIQINRFLVGYIYRPCLPSTIFQVQCRICILWTYT